MYTLVLLQYFRNVYEVAYCAFSLQQLIQLSLSVITDVKPITVRRQAYSYSDVRRNAKINPIVFIKQLQVMLNYRTFEIRGREFNSAHSGMALVANIVSSAWRDIDVELQAHVQRLPAPLLICPAALWPPSTTTRPTNVSSPTHRAVNHRLLHHADWSAVRKRWAARGHQWAVINRRPGACLLVATDFLGGAERHIGR